MKDAWLYLVLGAVLLYVLWGLDFTVAIDNTRPVIIRPSATGPEAINFALADELPVTW